MPYVQQRLGDATGTAVGATAGTAILGPGIGTAVGTLIGGLFGGGRYTGPTVQAGFLTWFNQGAAGRAILAQIGQTGSGPAWPGQGSSGTINYGGTIAPGSGGLPPGVPPTTMSTQQFAAWLAQQGAVSGTTPTTPSFTTPSAPGLTTASLGGLSLTNPLVIGAAVLAAVLLSRRKR